jgi:hypothetical protein
MIIEDKLYLKNKLKWQLRIKETVAKCNMEMMMQAARE